MADWKKLITDEDRVNSTTRVGNIYSLRGFDVRVLIDREVIQTAQAHLEGMIEANGDFGGERGNLEANILNEDGKTDAFKYDDHKENVYGTAHVSDLIEWLEKQKTCLSNAIAVKTRVYGDVNLFIKLENI